MSELSTGKSVMVCAVVVGCFAVLWPKIFHPMLFGRPPPVANFAADHPLNDRMRPDSGQRAPFPAADPATMRRTIDNEFKPGPMPGMMRPSMGGIGIPPQIQQRQNSQGAMGILLPLYTIGIVIFFVYTTLKLMLKKKEEPQRSNVPDLYRSYQSYMSSTDQKDDDVHEVRHPLASSASVVHTESAKDSCQTEEDQPESPCQSDVNSAGSQPSLSRSQSNESLKDDKSEAESETHQEHSKASNDTDIKEDIKKATESFEEEGDPREAEISRLRERLEATEKVMASIIGLMKSNNLDVPPLVSKEEQ